MTARSLASLFAAFGAAGSLLAADGTWTAASGGNWNDTANWAGGAIASGSGSTAYLTTGAGTVNNNETGLALLGVQLSGSGLTLAGNTLTLDSAGFITVLSGSHTVGLPLSVSGSTTLAAASGQALTLNGAVSGNGGLTANGGRVVLGAANTYLGATRHVTGTLEFNSPSALGSSPADAANLVLGEGTLRYTGGSATLNRGYTLSPGAGNDRAGVIDVVNAGTTLTVAGPVAAVGGAFIKTGEGTLAYTYPGYQEFNKDKWANAETAVITYDADGVPDTNSYPAFTVDKGRMILGAPGQTNVIHATAGWIGSKTLASPRLDIIGGVTRFIYGYFTIGRGTGTSASPQSPSMYLSGGAEVTVEGSGFVMDNSQGQPDHRCRPLLSIDNATLRVANDVFIGEDGNAVSTVSVANAGSFISDATDLYRWGLSLSQNDGAQTDMTFNNGSTGLANLLTVKRGATLNVLGGSTFSLDGTTLPAVNESRNQGTVRFSGSTLAQRTTILSSDWLTRLPDLLVGANNMTVDVASYACLDPQLKADPASPGGKLIKQGSGTLAMRPTAINVQADAGKVALAIEYPWAQGGVNGTFSSPSGAALELAAAGGAAGMNLALAGAPLTLSPVSLCGQQDRWRFNGSASWRPDGLLRLTPNNGGQAGSAFLLRRYPVTNAWTATFSYLAWSTLPWNPADGFSFVIQNDPRGAGALGTGGEGIGYQYDNKIVNSVAVGVDVYNKRFRFGKQGTYFVNIPFLAGQPHLSQPVKTFFTVSYDGSGKLTCLMTPPGSATCRYEYAVDLAAETTTDGYAYLGFSAGTGGLWGQHSIADFLFSNSELPTPSSYCRYGGSVALGGGDTLNASLAPSMVQRGFVAGQLAYADNAVVNVSKSVPAAPPAPTLADQGLWQLNANAHWKPDGRLAVSLNDFGKPGTAYTVNRYPVAGSWTAHFNYDIGLKTDPPADYITFAMQRQSPASGEHTPNPGFSIMWRYFEGGVTTTSLRMFTNGAPALASMDIAPVNLPYGGPASMTVSHDALAKTVTIITSQAAGAYTNVFNGVDLPSALGYADEAYLGFGAFTGGLYAENIVSDFSFTSEATANALGGYLAFDKLTGSGTLVKRGSAALGLPGDIDHPTSNAVVRLEQGGLVLRKNSLEPLDTTGARSDWFFTPIGKWGPDGTLQYCSSTWEGGSDTATSSRRVRISGPWTATFSYLIGAVNWNPQDAFSFFVHNDPRGPGAVGNNNVGAGYEGIARSTAIRWCTYPDHPAEFKYKSFVGHNGGFDYGSGQSYAPIVITAAETHFTIRYDPVAATLTSTITQGSMTVTHVFNNVNIPADVGDNYAYVGFGAGNGGACNEVRIRNFRMTSDTPVDALPNQQLLAGLTLPAASTNTATCDTSVPNGSFRIAAATVGDGASFGVDTVSQPGTLTLGSVTQTGSAAYPVAAGCTLVLTDVAGGTTVTKSGSGTLALAGAAATYTGRTVLGAGTLTLDAARLPEGADLYVTSGATLHLGFAGKQYVHALFVDGVSMPGGQYTAAKVPWISGPGLLVVTYPPVGTLLFLR